MKELYTGGTAEVTEKKSRFIATLQPVSSETEAVEFIASMKKKYWDARHNCYAFVIGSGNELTRCSDDGEPAQTAGRPMLEVLLHEEIHNAVVVVTRYFGGVLLGTGGLVRAYQKSVQEGLLQCRIADKQEGTWLFVSCEYTDLGKVQFLLAQEKIEVPETEYLEKVRLHAVVPESQKDVIWKLLTDKTNGRIVLEWGENVSFAEIDGNVEIFKKI